MSGKAEQPVFGNFPNDAKEPVEYLTKHGAKEKGDKSEVHPNTAILLRFNGIIKDNSKKPEPVKAEAKKKEVKPTEKKAEAPKKVVKKETKPKAKTKSKK